MGAWAALQAANGSWGAAPTRAHAPEVDEQPDRHKQQKAGSLVKDVQPRVGALARDLHEEVLGRLLLVLDEDEEDGPDAGGDADQRVH